MSRARCVLWVQSKGGAPGSEDRKELGWAGPRQRNWLDLRRNLGCVVGGCLIQLAHLHQCPIAAR